VSTSDDFTRWLSHLAGGDPQAAQRLWDEYSHKLVAFARRKLADAPRRAADEEDVALSAMASFCRALGDGRFPGIAAPADLSKLLLTITARKVCAQYRRDHALKRGGGLVRGESALDVRDEAGDPLRGIDVVLGREPTPELAASFAEQCRRMFDDLGEESLRRVALFAIQGYSPAEIAEKMGCVRRTVERKLERIREKWSRAEAV
jgi:RNA polymerase sigma factor (sigma-70 family)